MLRTQTEFRPSCRLMELDVLDNTTIRDSLQPFTINITTNDTADGLVALMYTQRELSISIDFLSGIFMNIEQMKEYSGK